MHLGKLDVTYSTGHEENKPKIIMVTLFVVYIN